MPSSYCKIIHVKMHSFQLQKVWNAAIITSWVFVPEWRAVSPRDLQGALLPDSATPQMFPAVFRNRATWLERWSLCSHELFEDLSKQWEECYLYRVNCRNM